MLVVDMPTYLWCEGHGRSFPISLSNEFIKLQLKIPCIAISGVQKFQNFLMGICPHRPGSYYTQNDTLTDFPSKLQILDEILLLTIMVAGMNIYHYSE